MAITDITISQDNIVNGSNLMPVHSTLVFLVDVTYTGVDPTNILVDIIHDSEVLETYKCIPFKDPLSNIRTFAFVANDVMKGLMGEFDDFAQLDETLEYVEGRTKLFTLKFYDPDDELVNDSVIIDLVHGAAQFGDDPNFDEIYNGADQIVYAPDGKWCYIYFYNEDINNVLTVGNPTATLELASDYDDVIFSDYDDEEFQIDVAI